MTTSNNFSLGQTPVELRPRQQARNDCDVRVKVTSNECLLNDNISNLMIHIPAGPRLGALLIQTVTCLSMKSLIHQREIFDVNGFLFSQRKVLQIKHRQCQNGWNHICSWTKAKGLALLPQQQNLSASLKNACWGDERSQVWNRAIKKKKK